MGFKEQPVMDSQYSPTRSIWENEDHWRHTDNRPELSLSPSGYQFMAEPSPFYRTSVTAPLYLSDFAAPSHGLPMSSHSPTMMANNYETPKQWQNETSPQPTPFLASHQASIEVASNPPYAQTRSKKQLQRRRELEDELYPLKLIRELHRISGKVPRVSKGRPVFEVIHVNNSIHNGLIVENVGTYATVQAANDRVLDFWDQKYSTRMFTTASPSFEAEVMSTNFEHIEVSRKQSYHVLPRKELNYGLVGGVSANNSHWAIDNMCLSLSHKSDHGENEVYVGISNMPFTNVFRTLASRPRSSTKGPLDVDDNPLASPTAAVSQAKRLSGSGSTSQNASPRTSLSQARSPMRSPMRTSAPQRPETSRDFSFLLKPEIYHQISPLTIPAPFRNPARQPAADTPIPTLLANGHFRAAAIAAAQELTATNISGSTTPISPTDYARIFDLLYVRLSCLCLIDAVPLAAQEAKALEDLNSAFYADADSGTHLAPWPLRTLVVRLQTIGFGDPRRAVMSYYELAREARAEIANAGKAHDHSAAEIWKRRLVDLGIRVAGALIEMDDLASATAHLASLAEANGGGADADRSRLAISRALLWLHLGDVDTARRCVAHGVAGEMGERVIDALSDMADGEYDAALGKWRVLREEMSENGVEDEMVGVNLAVCLLYTGRMPEGRDLLEELVSDGQASHTLLFNLTTMYELCSDRAKTLKVHLAERVAGMEPASGGGGWEKTNADFKL
ncbi:hypothetical protein E0Z10_g2913 [Xylaria hypoxylon]|uniref:Uncharacterized protein n=1 Tax=Xylaria hypoxylon TaxID=37992 RepID=A0A4Z0Z2Q2_9PEZI|nr:hypothetical protein E0Z10_g2913 [Xylaria hypoxylon]